MWAKAGGTLRKVVRSGDPAIGVPPGLTYGLSSVANIDGSGTTALLVDLPGPSSRGIYSEGTGTLRLVAREGEHAPGTPEGVVFHPISSIPLLNDMGQIAFTSFLSGAGVNSSNDEGVWSDRSGMLELIVRTGDVAARIVPAAAYRNFGRIVLNDAGQIAFDGQIAGPGINLTNNRGVWSEGAGAQLWWPERVILLARPSGVVYGSLGQPVINNAGQVAFSGGLSGSGVNETNDVGIWSQGVSGLMLVARKGGSAAGAPAGVTYGNFLDVLLNGAGKTVFSGYLSATGVNAANDTALWAERGAEVTLIVRRRCGDRSTTGRRLWRFVIVGGRLGAVLQRPRPSSISSTAHWPWRQLDQRHGHLGD